MIDDYHYAHKMSMTLTVAPSHEIASCCPTCGSNLPPGQEQMGLDAQKQIEDLQAQVRLLTQKATAAGQFPTLICGRLVSTIRINLFSETDVMA